MCIYVCIYLHKGYVPLPISVTVTKNEGLYGSYESPTKHVKTLVIWWLQMRKYVLKCLKVFFDFVEPKGPAIVWKRSINFSKEKMENPFAAVFRGIAIWLLPKVGLSYTRKTHISCGFNPESPRVQWEKKKSEGNNDGKMSCTRWFKPWPFHPQTLEVTNNLSKRSGELTIPKRSLWTTW